MYDSKLNRILALTADNKVLDGSNYGKNEGTNVWVSKCILSCVFRRLCCTTVLCTPSPPPHPHPHPTTVGVGLAEWTKPEGGVNALSKR